MKADDLNMIPQKIHFHRMLFDSIKELAELEQRSFSEVVRAYLQPAVTAELKQRYLILAAKKKLRPGESASA